MDIDLTEAAEAHAAALDRALDRAEQLAAWLDLALPPALAEHLRAEQRDAHDELATLLLRWRRAGGRLALELAPAQDEDPEQTPSDESLRPQPAPDKPPPTQDEDPEAIPSDNGPLPEPAVDKPPPARDESPEGALSDEGLRPEPAEDAGQAAPAEDPSAPDDAAEAPLPDGEPEDDEPTEESPAKPRAPAATVASLTRLKDTFARGDNFRVASPSAGWAPQLDQILDELDDAQEAKDELGAVLKVLEGRRSWPSFPKEVSAALVRWFVARLRAFQEEGRGGKRVDEALRRLTGFHGDTKGGFVHGLKRDHAPKFGSWAEDAVHAWTALLDWLPPPDARPQPAPKKQVKPPRPAPEPKPSPLPEDWAWWGKTRGKRAIVIGGEAREPNRARIQEAFGFASLDWEKAERTRNPAQQVRERVRSGKVDLVLVLTRFAGHYIDATVQPACKEFGVPFVPVQSGYGVVGLRRAMERHLRPADPPAEGAA